MTSEPTNFLYPFIDSEERDASGLLVDLAASARAKMAQSQALQLATLEQCSEELERAGQQMAERFAQGGRLFTFGNGGSATDAEATAQLFIHPVAGRPLPACSLVDDRAVLTALANDVGFELVFSRQLIAHGRPGDMAMGLSTSGNSDNVIRAFAEARHRGLLTLGLCGYDGGAMAGSPDVDHCLIVRSDSVHRIQEAQDALVFELWSIVQRHLGSDKQSHLGTREQSHLGTREQSHLGAGTHPHTGPNGQSHLGEGSLK
jgi:D-sedoheptulose 7-phosphate isomerase